MQDATVVCSQTGQRFLPTGRNNASITRIFRRPNTEVASATLLINAAHSDNSSNVLDLSSPQSANELATRVWRADHTGENSCTLPRDARLGISEIGTIYAKWHLHRGPTLGKSGCTRTPASKEGNCPVNRPRL